MFFEFSISFLLIFGFHRSYLLFSEEKFLSERNKNQIDRIFLVVILLETALFLFVPPLFVWILILSETLLLKNAKKILEMRLRNKFPVKTLAFLDELVLLMTAGKSFREASHNILQDREDIFSLKLREIITNLSLRAPNDVKNPTSNDMIRKFAGQLVDIDLAPQKAIERVRSLRRQWRWYLNFRRKSLQATAQVRAQAIILGVLYVSLMAWVLISQSLSKVRGFILVSLILFMSGLLLMFLLGRKNKWKT